MEVARRLDDVQLVSVDSMQVYRRMDIGTAKPTPHERAVVAHHCIDLVDPAEEFAVAEFKAAYAEACSTISREGGSALLVGGTGLYHRVVVDDFDLPGTWPGVRDELDAVANTAELHAELLAIDPLAAARIEPSNRRRIVRALEVTLGSGRPFSSFGPGVDSYPPSQVVQIGIRRPRSVLAEAIAQRVHRMIDRGLVEEVRSIATSVGFSRTAAQALGYKETLAHLDGRISQDEAVDMIITRTRQFSVRQDRWFRRDPRVRWIDVDHDPVAEVVPAVIDALTST
jgi:tRNA dimethylallyltransferase